MHARHPFIIQRDVMTAIFLRELKTRFTGYVLGNFWIILEPLLMVSMFILVFGLRGRGEFGYAEPAVFILAAFLPFKLLWQFNMNKTKGAVSKAKQYGMFRQITLFDVFLTTALVEYFLFIFVGVLLVLVLLWFGFDPVPRDILAVLGYAFMLWTIGISVGIAAAMVSRFASEIQIILGIFTLPAMFFSAVFYPMAIVPEPYRTWLAYNPLVHAMEFIRQAWLGTYVSPVADLTYLSAWTIGLLVLAMCQYSLNWRRLMIQ